MKCLDLLCEIVQGGVSPDSTGPPGNTTGRRKEGSDKGRFEIDAIRAGIYPLSSFSAEAPSDTTDCNEYSTSVSSLCYSPISVSADVWIRVAEILGDALRFAALPPVLLKRCVRKN